MKEFEFIGKTVELAIEEGLKTLQLTREEAEITVLEEGKNGLFKKIPAKIKMVKKMTDGERAVEFLDGVFNLLNVTATNELTEDEKGTKIQIITTQSYSVIGRRGEILDSLQTLAGAIANIGREDYKRVVVDCENYREKREETLKKLAQKLAEKAVKTGRKVAIEPMSPYERRIIHSALSDSTEVKTTSEGKEPNRFIVIIPNNLKPGADKPIRSDRKGGGKKFNGDKKQFNKNGNRRGGNRPQGKPAAKRAPFFGTYLGNSNKKDV